MIDISYNPEEYTVTSKEKDFGDPVGEYRIIRYNTGYYALQRHNVDMVSDNPGGLIWETLCIAPQLDTPLDNGYDWKFSQGRLTMKSFLGFLEDAAKLHNNEYMELHLNLNRTLDDKVHDEIVNIIKSDDGKLIADKIRESIQLQDEYFKEDLEKRHKEDRFIKIGCFIIVLICFLILLYTTIYGAIL